MAEKDQYLKTQAQVSAARDRGDVDFLIRCLSDADARVRARAARYLGHLKSPKAVRPLIRMFKSEPHRKNKPRRMRYGDTRVLIVRALVRIGDEQAMRMLFDIIRSNAPFGVRFTALKLLADLKEPKVLVPLARLLVDPTLAQQIRSDPIPEPRWFRTKPQIRRVRRLARRYLRQARGGAESFEAVRILNEGLPTTRGIQRWQLNRLILHLSNLPIEPVF